MEKKIDSFRKMFDVSSKYGWFLPLVIPFFLCYLSMNRALEKTGLMAERVPLTNAVATITNYTSTLRNINPEPIIRVQEWKNGMRESRLVVRALGFEEVGSDVFLPFIFPMMMVGLIGGFGCAMILRFKSQPNDQWRLRSQDILMTLNLVAIGWFLGLPALMWLLAKI